MEEGFKVDNIILANMNFDREIFESEEIAQCDEERWDELCGWDNRSYGVKIRYSLRQTTKTSNSYTIPKPFQKTSAKFSLNLKKSLFPKPASLQLSTPQKHQILKKSILPQLPLSSSPLDSIKIINSLVASYKKCKISLKNTYHLTSQTPALLIRRSNKYT